MENNNELDNLDAIEAGGTANEDITLSNVYPVNLGGFGSGNLVRTYLCSVKIKDLKEDIDFYEQLTKDKSWPVSQIIQREVDKVRVSNISKNYVLGHGRLVKYFPPIIIAILPKADDGKIELKLAFNPDNSEKIKGLIYERSKYRTNSAIKPYFIKGTNRSLVDGLYILEVSKVFEFNLLCWDKCKYYAIVIDGQHRLDSLFRSMKDNQDVGNFLQDVVFIDLSNLIKNATQPKAPSPVEIVRRIFVDINTNAQKVGVVRQILMDDKDLPSLCVQSLVDAVWKDGSEKPKDYYIASQIVDWYGETLKHQLPHITGILSLHQILEDNLILKNLSSIKELRSEKKVVEWVQRMNDIFLVDQKIKTLNKYSHIGTLESSLKDYYDRKEGRYFNYDDDDDVKETEIFVYNYGVLDVAQETFQEIFLKPLVSVFSKFSPYRKVIRIIEENGGFDHEKILNQALISSRKRLKQNSSYLECLFELKKKIDDEVTSIYYIIFTVLGQKTIFSLLFQRINREYSQGFNEEKCQKIVDDFFNEVNDLLELLSYSDIELFGPKENCVIPDLEDNLVDLGVIATSFWDGIIYENNSIIYNSQGIRSLSSLLHYLLFRFEELISGKESNIEFNISYLEMRIKRNVSKSYPQYTEESVENFAKQIIEVKEKFINNLLVTGFNKWSTPNT